MAGVRSSLVALYTSDALGDLRRRWHRRARGRRRQITLVHQLDDPYGLLLLQVIERLVAHADAELRVAILPSPSEALVPDRARLAAWALRDAAALAELHALEFPTAAKHPSETQLAAAQTAALAQIAALPGSSSPTPDAVAGLRALSHALLAGEPIQAASASAREQASARLAANAHAVAQLGHYQGGMLHYEGEWYWGLDRLPLLEQRLRDEGLSVPPTLDWSAQPQVRDGRLWGARLPEPGTARPELELFYSMRSPYSYLALARSIELAASHDVQLRVRLVLPMVMRGLAVPWLKRRYIVFDAKRIAGQLRLPFGRIADPVGVGIERCMAVAAWAEPQGRLLAFMQSVGSAVWAEGIDVASDRGLRRVAARAGLDEHEALRRAQDQDWRPEIERNREALLNMGLWGVPCFRYGALTLWGQDRLPVLAAALRSTSHR